MYLPRDIEKVINHFSNLPGIGPKSASRLALAFLRIDKLVVEDFAQSLVNLKNNVTFCSKCYNLSDDKLCGICNDQERVENQIMVVEDVLDLVAFERTGQYTGKYHVLGGLLSPMQGVGPEDLTIDKLIKRMKNIPGEIELILATSPSLEGEATAMFITEQLHDIPEISITRIARGVPTGADLDYTDKLTLLRALENRTKMPQ